MKTTHGIAVLTDETGHVTVKATLASGAVESKSATIALDDSPYSVEIPAATATDVKSVALYFESTGGSTWCKVARG